MKMIIEGPEAIELDELLAIFNKAKSSTTGFNNTVTDLENFLKEIDGEKVYVAKSSNNIVGFLSLCEQENFIHHLYIAPEFQSQGFGGALLKECEMKHGLPLTLKCLKGNERACAFYIRNGWTEMVTAEGPDGLYIVFQLANV
jgi:ribosomal protein S18 acetylase RimI-like enzyme